MPRVLIIDDEPYARDDLRHLLAAHPDCEVVGEAGTVPDARARLRRADYDLVFLDIQLFGGSGFDLVPDVRAGAKVVFATAHNEHALRAFEVNALDYLLKPIKAERLAASLARLAKPDTMGTDPGPVVPRSLRYDDTVHLNSGDRARFARVADISRIEAQENYSLVQLDDGSQMLVRRTLKSWEDVLPPKNFLRVHRTTVVNLERVVCYDRPARRAITLGLAGRADPVSVSRDSTTEVKARLHARFPEI